MDDVSDHANFHRRLRLEPLPSTVGSIEPLASSKDVVSLRLHLLQGARGPPPPCACILRFSYAAMVRDPLCHSVLSIRSTTTSINKLFMCLRPASVTRSCLDSRLPTRIVTQTIAPPRDHIAHFLKNVHFFNFLYDPYFLHDPSV